ncbi:hypothetical protein Tsubulata_017352 [Turnera subulata]|uniref:Uncharacterized protein n=1 Tax=Turnera subulata TaxID=218843 RepID=A0A9Q0GC62_9ROSI|nr:hypothetical protein Tsubulata_017352 [Turnera subulata]
MVKPSMRDVFRFVDKYFLEKMTARRFFTILAIINIPTFYNGAKLYKERLKEQCMEVLIEDKLKTAMEKERQRRLMMNSSPTE